MTASTSTSGKQLFNQLKDRLVSGLTLVMLSISLIGCSAAEGTGNISSSASPTNGQNGGEQPAVMLNNTPSDRASNPEEATELATATFAGGCFWCMEQPFDALPGVTETTSGYTGGTVENPTYSQVSNGNTGHIEAMQVSYDPTQVSYDQLLDTFWHNIDPFDNQGQFCDKGSQYRSAVFYETPEQQAQSEAAKQALAAEFDQPIATDILPAATFYPAEDYHQNYYQTRPVRYKVYRYGCGRDQRLSDVWGDKAPSHD